MINTFCPLPQQSAELVGLAHGAGGQAMQNLIQSTIAPLYGEGFAPDHDGAAFPLKSQIAFTTDSYVVKPLFFPGGDIGKLAVYGTINDLAMCGAQPLYLSCSLILEEGFSVGVLQSICQSMAQATHETGVKIVTGDTKVVGRGQCDGIYINTAGIGQISRKIEIHPRRLRPGDRLILSGDLGRHGMAVMAARDHILVDGDLVSDCAPLADSIQTLLTAGIDLRCLRDLTRGGLASALHELSHVTKLGFEIEEAAIPVSTTVKALCEILGIDPLYVANEGCFLAVVDAKEVSQTLTLLRSMPISAKAVAIGSVTTSGYIEMSNPYGSKRLLSALQGELLPRIC